MPTRRPSTRVKLLLTCEHGGHDVPAAYRHLFAGADAVLRSHRGWDPGALRLFTLMSRAADAAYATTVTRLLVELNRSPHHPQLLSAHSRRLDTASRAALLDAYYHPFRRTVADRVKAWLDEGTKVLHVSVHSFAPVLRGRVRDFDIGLLYDPRHGTERAIATAWQRRIRAADPTWQVRRNRPYRGVSDGHTRWLRATFGIHYGGLELEVRNDHLRRARAVERLASVLISALPAVPSR